MTERPEALADVVMVSKERFDDVVASTIEEMLNVGLAPASAAIFSLSAMAFARRFKRNLFKVEDTVGE